MKDFFKLYAGDESSSSESDSDTDLDSDFDTDLDSDFDTDNENIQNGGNDKDLDYINRQIHYGEKLIEIYNRQIREYEEEEKEKGTDLKILKNQIKDEKKLLEDNLKELKQRKIDIENAGPLVENRPDKAISTSEDIETKIMEQKARQKAETTQKSFLKQHEEGIKKKSPQPSPQPVEEPVLQPSPQPVEEPVEEPVLQPSPQPVEEPAPQPAPQLSPRLLPQQPPERPSPRPSKVNRPERRINKKRIDITNSTEIISNYIDIFNKFNKNLLTLYPKKLDKMRKINIEGDTNYQTIIDQLNIIQSLLDKSNAQDVLYDNLAKKIKNIL